MNELKTSLQGGHALLYQSLCFVADSLARLGFPVVSSLGSRIGALMWHTLPNRRMLATNNIVTHLGMDEEPATQVAKQSFSHSGRSFAELLLTQRFGLDYPGLRFSRPELWQALLETRRPAVAATAHFGAWELMASLLGQMHWPGGYTEQDRTERSRLVVVRRYDNPVVQAFISRQRQATGAAMVGHRRVAGEVLKGLRNNGVAAFLVDHSPLPDEATSLSFLGESTGVNMGPAILAVRSEAIIWPAFLLRDKSGYLFEQYDPLDTRDLPGTREEKVQAAARFYTDAVEKVIRSHPEQWFWMHNRWKNKDTNR